MAIHGELLMFVFFLLKKINCLLTPIIFHQKYSNHNSPCMALYCRLKCISAIINARIVLPDKLKARWWLTQLWPVGFLDENMERRLVGTNSLQIIQQREGRREELLNWLKSFLFELYVHWCVPQKFVSLSRSLVMLRNVSVPSCTVGTEWLTSGYSVAVWCRLHLTECCCHRKLC